MRGSEPMPLRTDSMSAPTTSQSRASSFMNEMRVASIALAAYLVSSAERDVHDLDAIAGAQHAAIELAQELDRARIVGADDHARGLEEVVDRVALLEELGVRGDRERVLRRSMATAARTLSAVPTGTVLLVTTTVKPVSAAPICRAASST